MDVNALLTRYQELGFRLVYWEREGVDSKAWKGPSPTDPKSKGWNAPERIYPLSAYDPSRMNLGVITGHEISPGHFLADVDLDWAGGLVLAPRLLPPTRFGFGRRGKKLSHAFFTTPEQLPLAVYDDVADDGTESRPGHGERFVELRSGHSSHQTMIAPSLHSPNVHVELAMQGPILHVSSEQLQQAVLDYAIACLILKRTPGGLHHEGRVPLSGFLLRHGLAADRVIAILEAVCSAQSVTGITDMSEKDVKDAGLAVRTTVARLAAQKRVAGASKFAEFIGPVGKAVVMRLREYLGLTEDFIRTAEGVIKKDDQYNIRHAIELMNIDLSRNSFNEKMMVNREQPLDDGKMDEMWLRIDEEYHFRPTFTFFEKVVRRSARSNPYHPVREYLDGLTWDGTPRINYWLKTYGHAEDTSEITLQEREGPTYLEAISAIVLIAAVRRVRKPGCKYDEMLIIESPQGLNKSSALRMLCPDDSWFSDDLPLNCESKEVIERTLGKWIIEAAEMVGGRKADRDHLKSMLSRQVDGPARMAYAREAVERAREFIIIGTTNSAEYLADTTGARRFWPVRATRFDLDALVKDRNQLWAEANEREAKGESIRLAEYLWTTAEETQELRRTVDAWEEQLLDVVEHLEPLSTGDVRVFTHVLWDALGIRDVAKRDRIGAMRIAEIMQRFGFTPQTIKDSTKVVRGYVKKVTKTDVVAKNDEDDDVPF